MQFFRLCKVILCASVMLMSNLHADANEVESIVALSLEQLLNVEVTSASKYAQKSSEAPSAVAVLTAEDIHTFGYRTLGDALGGLRGLYTSNDRNYSYLGVRGFLHPNDYTSRILIMVDGRRMNENIYDSGFIGQEFMLDLDLVTRIEYIPGPGSSVYGANAVLGVVNVITKNGQDINGVQAVAELASFDSNKLRATYGNKLQNGADVLFSASQYNSGGQTNLYFSEFDTPATNNGIAHHMDNERASRLFTKIQFEELTLTAGYVDRFKQIPTASFGAIFNDPAYRTTDTMAYANLKYETALSDKTSLEMNGFYQWYGYEGVEPYDTTSSGGPSRVINIDKSAGLWWGGEAKLVTTAFDKQKIVLGSEYQFDQQQKLFTYDVNPYFVYQDSNRSGSRIGLYAQDDLTLRDNLVLSAGMRLDYHHMLKNMQLNPRLGLIWHPLQTTTVKLLYGSAFRAPNIYERDYKAFGQEPNPNNKEERIKTYEGIVEWQPGSGLKLMGSLFYNDFSQVLELPNGATGQFVNSGKPHAYGYEFEAEKRWGNGRLLKASLNHTLLQEEGGAWAIGSPKNVFQLHYAEPLFGNAAKLGVESIFVDKRKAPQGGFAASYNLVNLNLSSKKLLTGLNTSFGIYNLFNTHYENLGGGGSDLVQNVLKMDGRSLRLNLEYTF